MPVGPRGKFRTITICKDCGSTRPPLKIWNRWIDALYLLSQGKSNKEIGWHLGICEGTVKAHLFKMYKEMGFGNRYDAIVWALNHAALLKEKTGVSIKIERKKAG